MKILMTTFLCLIGLMLGAQSHQSVFTNLSGEDLLTAVRGSYTPDYTASNSVSKDLLYGTIYNVNDSVSCVYTGYRIYLNPNDDPSQAAFAQGINREHTFPNTYVDGSLGENDMHHLFPSREDVNGDRGNYPFAEIPDNLTEKWYYLDQENSNIPTQNLNKHSELRLYDFEPREDHKGNVARAMMYAYTIYKNVIDFNDNTYFNLQREVLCEWHGLDPVDELEWDRTWMIANYQDDKPNPYVLDCSLAYRAFCPEFQACIPPNSTRNLAAVYVQFQPNTPNPFYDKTELNYSLLRAGKVHLTIYDMLGRPVKTVVEERQAAGDYQLEVEGLKGLFLANLQVEVDGQWVSLSQRLLGL